MSKGSVYAVIAACALGTLLGGCASRPTSAPVTDRSPATVGGPKPPVAQAAPVPGAPSVSTPQGFYQVKRGDTLYSIALDHGAEPREVRDWNRLENPDRILVGQLLRVTPPEEQPPVQVGAARGAGPVESRPIESRPLGPVNEAKPAASRPQESKPALAANTGTVKTEPKALRLPYSSENLAMMQKSDPQAAAIAPLAKPEAAKPAAALQPAPPANPAAEPREADAIEFIWPARGKVVGKFAEPSSKGIDIAGKPGDPVVAAAGGRVIYIGTGIRGYGKLIVIKHDNNFNSVYAHNREILVKQDQTVTRGQQIAELGDTDADSPKLHFEIRKSGKPVDPAKFLPPS